MRRPALNALLLFVAGILLGHLFDLPLILLFSVFCLALTFSLLSLFFKDQTSVNLFLVLSLLLAGFLRHEMSTREFPSNHISRFLDLDSDVTIAGRIVDEPDVRKNKSFITLEAERIWLGEEARSATGRIMLKIKEPTFRFDYADNLRFKGYLNQPASRRNPGAFDYKRYLNRKRISGIVTLTRADQAEILDRGEGSFFLSKVVIPLRRWILGVFESNLSGDHKALLAGFLLGETREISRDVYTMFRDTGTVHLLAVSGSNVWLVVGVIFAALSLLRIPRVPTTVLSLICILIFANLVHNDPPVVRAGIMAAVVLLGVLIYRDVDLMNVLSFAGLVILLFSPLFLFDVGFQLSFASVFGILLLYPRLSKVVAKYVGKSHRKLWRWVLMPALISISVELVLFPILAYYFNMIPLVIVVANLFIVPLAGLSVVLACFSLFSATFSTFLAGVFSASNWLCLDLTLRFTHFFANLPLAKISIAAPSALGFVIYYLVLWVLFGSFAAKKKALVFSVLILVNLLVWKQALAGGDKPLTITFLDVSQGSSAVIRLPNEETLLLNAGEKGVDFDAGEYIVIPFLNHEGITRIDRLILTDVSPLNLNSAGSIAEDRQVEEVILPRASGRLSETYSALLDGLSSRFVFLDSGDAITDRQREFGTEFLEYKEAGRPGSAASSMVVKVAYRDVSLCVFDAMKKSHFDPEFQWDQARNCSLLILSELGEAEEIVKVISAVRPERIVFTRHYFRYEKDKIPTLMALSFPEIEYIRTKDHGAVTCETDGKTLRFDLTIR
ncbi:MAG: ComEC/Rec2 family competence protein [Candidatus Zixiibacteriota bacterium]|nr:MAG: ComEC/Rec2 family competence protein [candidate division Zixibacteria bacterium]